VNLNEIAAAWREARRIYPVYAALIRQFALGVRPSAELESPINRSEPEVLAKIARWFDEVDDKCEVWQLRQVLQTAAWVSDDQLRSMVRRHLKKTSRDVKVRDKVDYLMVQYYAHYSPQDAHNQNITFEHVAQALEELTGSAESEPSFGTDLQKVLNDLGGCSSLKHLLEKKLIERSREIKERSGEKYFEAGSLVAFARFNFMMRLGFFRLMHADLHAMRFALHAMEERGQSECDCSSAGLSKNEPIAQLRQICYDWKKPFRAAYSAAVNFKQIVELRAAVEAAEAAPVPAPKKEVVAVPKPAAVETPKSEPKRVEVPASPKLLTIEECIEQIAERMLHTTIKNAQVTNLMFGDLKILLASWEVQAFTHGGDESADTMQRAVAARVALSLAMEEKRSGRAADISEAIGWAHAEAAQIQERIAEAKEKKNIDAAVNLAATSKRLVALVTEAEKV
jgi:hypothetical protein